MYSVAAWARAPDRAPVCRCAATRVRRDRLEVLGHGRQVGVRQVRRAVAHHFGHRPERGGAARDDAGLQVAGNLGRRPAAQAGVQVGRQVEREPAIDAGAGVGLVFLDAAQRVARRVAGTAMAQAFHQVGAAVPRRWFAGVGLEGAFGEIQLAPHRHRPPLVERKAQLVDVHRVDHRGERAQVGVDRVAVLARDAGVEVVGHGRVHVLPVAVDPFVHRPVELVCAPQADAGFRIGRDVGREQSAKRRVQTVPAGKGHATVGRVAGDAVARTGQVFAALGRCLRGRRRAGQPACWAWAAGAALSDAMNINAAGSTARDLRNE
jgi:hypothetical protein